MTQAQLSEDGSMVKPLGDGRWAWFPYGDFGPGFVADEAQRVRLKRHRLGLGLLALCGMLGLLLVILLMPSPLSVLSHDGFWIGLVLYFGGWALVDYWMVALQPKSPVRLSRSEAIDLATDRMSNAGLAYILLISPCLVVLIGWSAYQDLLRKTLGSIIQAQFGLVFIAAMLYLAPRLIAIAGRKWSGWWVRGSTLLISLLSAGGGVLLVRLLAS